MQNVDAAATAWTEADTQEVAVTIYNPWKSFDA
jgi:hypothetical protein